MAIANTRHRLAKLDLGRPGKLILVNIPSRTLACYLDGIPELEMKVVCGTPRTPTPELDTSIAFVRPNPTWTVPQSILREAGWRVRLQDHAFLARNGFTVRQNGTYVVQAPGPQNALGLVKFGLHNAGAIYLHDTNEPGSFKTERRLFSHGCVRVEKPWELADWILGYHRGEAQSLQEDGDETDIKPDEPVSVILGYFTAWPDSTGEVRYYPDVYKKDVGQATCGSAISAWEAFNDDAIDELDEGP